MKRINGISTPLGGLSWTSKLSIPSDGWPSSEPYVLTALDCAQILRVDEQAIIKQLESGKLGGFKLNKEWRVLPQQLIEFLNLQVQTTQFDVLKSCITDPKVWVAELSKRPDLMKEIETGNFPENSAGRFLQDALASFKLDHND